VKKKGVPEMAYRRVAALLHILIFICLVSGCAGRWSSINLNKISPSGPGGYSYERDYTIGPRKTAYIGKPILQVKTHRSNNRVKQVVADQAFHITSRKKFSTFTVDVPAKTVIPVAESVSFSSESWEPNHGETYYLARVKGSDGGAWGLLIGERGAVFPYGLYSYDWDMMFCSSTMKADPVYKFRVVDEPVLTGSAGTYELIFSGKNDTSLNAIYREYTADEQARPAFYQNLTYEPNARQIRFKDFVIQIHEVSNEAITYSIVADDRRPQ
jgi:hypothetical protein